jgi:poly(3-hydroxybutyrate) depolymerase
MNRRLFFFFLVLGTLAASAAPKSDSQKLSITSEGKSRTYYLFVPAGGTGPKPLLLLLHGSGHNGTSLIDPWKGLAEKEGIILAAPDSLNSQEWSFPVDGPNFLHEVVEAVKANGSTCLDTPQEQSSACTWALSSQNILPQWPYTPEP